MAKEDDKKGKSVERFVQIFVDTVEQLSGVKCLLQLNRMNKSLTS